MDISSGNVDKGKDDDKCNSSPVEVLINLADLKAERFPLRKIPTFHLISWCGSFLETYSFC